MPFVQITWLPKACRTAAVRQQVADAVIKVWSVRSKGSADDRDIPPLSVHALNKNIFLFVPSK